MRLKSESVRLRLKLDMLRLKSDSQIKIAVNLKSCTMAFKVETNNI